MSIRPLVLFGLVSSVALACGRHSSRHGSSATTYGDAGGDGGEPVLTPSDDSGSADDASGDDGSATGDSGATSGDDGSAETGPSVPACSVPAAAMAVTGCMAIAVGCLSASNCPCGMSDYQMICELTTTPPGALGCISQGNSAAYCCPCESDDAGLPSDAGSPGDAGLVRDAGPASDAGIASDGGVATDAGTPRDAGSAGDAGGIRPADAGVSD